MSSLVSQARRAWSDAVADLVHVRGVMGVGVDYDFYAVLFGQAEMTVAQVEAVGIGIQFHGDLVFGGGFQDGVYVELVGVAAEQHASGGMAED